jgi:hypothetical protein
MDFRWNEWNLDHIAEHGVAPEDVEYVIQNAVRPFPRYEGKGKYRVWGRAADGYYLQASGYLYIRWPGSNIRDSCASPW